MVNCTANRPCLQHDEACNLSWLHAITAAAAAEGVSSMVDKLLVVNLTRCHNRNHRHAHNEQVACKQYDK